MTRSDRRSLLLLLFWVGLLGYFFAMTEIQIEGASGWAASLPTWRIEKHPLLDIFWGGRPMTGYHAWVFPFMALVFHLPLVYVMFGIAALHVALAIYMGYSFL